jgi:hypothetical protein
MSRSRKHTPIHSHTTARSEKEHKRAENHRERVAERASLVRAQAVGTDDADAQALDTKLVAHQWGPKDGKSYWKIPTDWAPRERAKLQGK